MKRELSGRGDVRGEYVWGEYIQGEMSGFPLEWGQYEQWGQDP